MALITIQFGSRASSSTLNNNFRYLAELIQSQIQSLTAIVNNSKSSMEAITASLETTLYKIGEPKISLVNTLQNNEIWLEGAEVRQSDYPNLYALWGNTYGTASQAGCFKLPDFRNRALWGSNGFGYINAGLPNITGRFDTTNAGVPFSGHSGVFYADGGYWMFANQNQDGWKSSGGVAFNASRSNALFGSSNTVQPPAIKIRVKTRYA